MSIGSGACRSVPTDPMHSPEEVSIASGPLSARFRPAWGGRMTHLSHARLGQILVPTQEARFEPYQWPRAGAYPLFPYHNRLYDASFIHGGVQHHLRAHPALAPDAIHGPAHRRPWSVAAHADDRLTLQLDYQADEEWPFSFLAEQHFRLEANRLVVELAITNRSDIAAPVGLGWHPYIAAPVSSHAETDARLEYPLAPLNVPTVDPPQRRSNPAIPSATGYTLHFSDWSLARVTLAGGEVLLEADPVFSHLAVHRMENYLCIEPVSMAAGVLSMPEAERQGRGLKILPPGGRLAGRITMSIMD